MQSAKLRLQLAVLFDNRNEPVLFTVTQVPRSYPNGEVGLSIVLKGHILMIIQPEISDRLTYSAWQRLRIATSAFTLLLAFTVALLPIRCRAVDIDAMIGFGQTISSRSLYRPETPTPLTVYLSGMGLNGQAQLQVTVRSNEHTTQYSRKVSLHDGPIKEPIAESFVFEFEPNNFYMNRSANVTDVEVQLVVDGRQVAHKSVSLPATTSAESFNVLALTRNGGGLNFLTTKKLGLFRRHGNDESYVTARSGNTSPSPNGINPNATLTLSYTRTDALPIMMQGYAMMDAIVLGDLPLDMLSDAQIEALKGYVRNGGLLIVSGGGDLARLKSRFYSEMLPIEVTGSALTQHFPALEQRYRSMPHLVAAEAIVTGRLKPESVVLLGGSDPTPTVTSRPYGAGTVVLTSFDFMDASFRSWPGGPAMWRDLLRSDNPEVEARGVFATTPQEGISVNLLIDALAGKNATNIPGFYTIAGFLAAYIILLIPVSYLILKRLDKRELAWYTAPGLIAAFTVFSYLLALTIKGGNLNVNRAVVLESQSGSSQYAGYGQLCIYSPRRSSYDISLTAASDPSSGAESDTSGDVSPSEIYLRESLGSDLNVEQNGQTILRNTQMGLWAKRSFAVPFSVSLGGALTAKTRMLDKNRTEVTITNGTHYTIKDCALLNGDTNTPVNNSLAPGASVKVTVKWAYQANASSYKLPGAAGSLAVFDPNDKDTPDGITGKLRYAMTQAMSLDSGEANGNGFMGGGGADDNYGKVPNVLIGWTTDPFLHVSINGHEPQGQEMNLLVVHLPTPPNATANIARSSNPFASDAVVNLEDERGPTALKPVPVSLPK